MAQQALPTLGIKRIKLQAFAIDEAGIREAGKLLNIDFQLHLSFAPEQNLVNLIHRVFYRYLEPDAPTLVDIAVQNIFEVAGLQDFRIGATEIKLPSATITAIVGLAISHTRAILSTHLAGTALQDSLPAIVDPRDVAMHFFPHMFENADDPRE